MNTSPLLLAALLTLTGCFHSSERDEDDDDGTGGGWDLGTNTGQNGDGGGVNWDGGGMGGTIDPDGGAADGGASDGGAFDGGTSDGGTDGGTTDGGTGGTDADGDGWTVEAGDCNDGDDEIYPGAHEVQDDGFDFDCDGWDDEWSGIWHLVHP